MMTALGTKEPGWKTEFFSMQMGTRYRELERDYKFWQEGVERMRRERVIN